MKQQKAKKETLSNLSANCGIEEDAADGLQATLQAFRDSIHATAEKPEDFWTRQRAGIRNKLSCPDSPSGRRPVLSWVAAAIILLVCFAIFTERSQTPTFAFAAGDDQILLIEIERALSRRCPEALTPAVILSQEIVRADADFKQTSPRK